MAFDGPVTWQLSSFGEWFVSVASECCWGGSRSRSSSVLWDRFILFDLTQVSSFEIWWDERGLTHQYAFFFFACCLNWDRDPNSGTMVLLSSYLCVHSLMCIWAIQRSPLKRISLPPLFILNVLNIAYTRLWLAAVRCKFNTSTAIVACLISSERVVSFQHEIVGCIWIIFKLFSGTYVKINGRYYPQR